jgi:hypothetical protein
MNAFLIKSDLHRGGVAPIPLAVLTCRRIAADPFETSRTRLAPPKNGDMASSPWPPSTCACRYFLSICRAVSTPMLTSSCACRYFLVIFSILGAKTPSLSPAGETVFTPPAAPRQSSKAQSDTSQHGDGHCSRGPFCEDSPVQARHDRAPRGERGKTRWMSLLEDRARRRSHRSPDAHTGGLSKGNYISLTGPTMRPRPLASCHAYGVMFTRSARRRWASQQNLATCSKPRTAAVNTTSKEFRLNRFAENGYFTDSGRMCILRGDS